MSYLAAVANRTVVGCFVLGFAIVAHGADPIVNGTIERGTIRDPEAWHKACVPSDGLIMRRTRAHPFRGEWSLSISCVANYDRTVSNNWCQELKGLKPGTTFRLVAAVRGEKVTVGNVCIQCWSEDNSLLAYASTPPVRGSCGWTRFESDVLTIPKAANRIILRAALTGTGRIWFDNIQLVEVDRTTQTNSLPDEIDEGLAALLPGKLMLTLPVKKDCMVLAYLPEWNHGLVDNLGVANNAGGVRALLQWSDVDPDLATDNKSRFLLALYSRKTTSKSSSSDIEIARLREDWAEKTSWQSQPLARNGSGKSLVRREFSESDGWQLFDVTSIVRQEAKEKAKHHGVVIRFEDVQPLPESRSGISYLKQSQTWSGYSFVSREGAGKWSSYRPRLLVVEANADSDQ